MTPRALGPAIATLALLSALAACSGPVPAVDASALPSAVGLLVAEASEGQDSAALEAWAPVSHAYELHDGFGLDPDTVLRARVDPRTGRVRRFSLQRRAGVLVERNASGLQLARWDVYDAGSPPAAANPHDVAIGADGSLWVTRFGAKSLLVIGPDGARSTVDLSGFADADGKPEMDALAWVGGRLYVTLARIQGTAPPLDAPLLVAVDPTTRTVDKVLELPCRNPSGELRAGARVSELWVSCLGGPLSTPVSRQSGLVRMDVEARTADRLFPGETLGRFVTAFALLSGDAGVAILASFGDDNPTSVVEFDPRGTGTLGKTWAASTKYAHWDLEGEGDTIVVADRDPKAPGVLVFDRTGRALGKVATRLPPVDVLLVRSL